MLRDPPEKLDGLPVGRGPIEKRCFKVNDNSTYSMLGSLDSMGRLFSGVVLRQNIDQAHEVDF